MIKIKLKRAVAALLCAVMLAGAFSSCASGKSAYDIAVENGFEGSVEQWLESLRGADGKDLTVESGANISLSVDDIYNAAVKGGYTGTKEEYVREVLGIESEEDKLIRNINRSLLSTVSVISYFNFGSVNGPLGTSTSRSGSVASGVIVELDKEKGDAYIVTNYHAIYESTSTNKLSNDVSVYLYGLEYSDQAIPAEIVGYTVTYDIAVLKVTDSEVLKNSNAVSAEWRSSDTVIIGETVYTTGNPESQGISSAVGTVTLDTLELEVDRADGKGEVTMRLLRTDTSLNHGNSGGGLYDKNGKVIGIVVAKNTNTDVDEIGYVIPSDIAMRAANNIIISKEKYNSSTIKKCLLGITVTAQNPYTETDGKTGAVLKREEVTVMELVPNSAAYGKIFEGDIILSMEKEGDKVEAHRIFNIVDYMLTVFPGDTVNVTVLRGEEEIVIPVTFTNEALTDVN